MAVGSLALAKPGGANRRGRPSASRTAEIEQTIRAAALEVFLSAGYEAASMDAIAAAAQVSKGTLYARHSSKEALFRSVLEGELQKLSDRAGANDHRLPSDLRQRLSFHARTLIASMHTGEFERLQKLVASAQLAFPDTPRLWHELATQPYVRFLADDMAAHARVPPEAEVDWLFFANVFLHAIGGWQRAEQLMRTVSDEEALAFGEAVIDTIFKSIPHSG